MTVKVLFVCLGNICRSPTAHGLFQDLVDREGLSKYIEIDSAGTGDWHIGHAPDKRAQETAVQRGYDISHLRARQVIPADFHEYDYVLGMDRENIHNLKALAPENHNSQLGLFLSVAGVGDLEVADPYYGGEQHFVDAIQLIEDGCQGLLSTIRQRHGI